MVEISAGIEGGVPSFGISGIGGGSKTHSKRPYNFARETQLNQIQRRAKDAKKAGLHPLAALGISPAGSPPHQVGSQSGIEGQVSSKTLSGPEAAAIRESNARTKLLGAQTDEVKASMAASLAARAKEAIQNHQDKPIAQAVHKGMLVESGVAKFANTPDAQQLEDRYGEIGGLLGGLVNMGADGVANIPESVFDSYVDKLQKAYTSRARSRRRLRNKIRKYKPGYSFSPYQSQRKNWK